MRGHSLHLKPGLSALLAAAGITLCALPLRAAAPTIEPSSLAFESRQGDTPLLTVEADFGAPFKSPLAAEITGIDCDRRITSLGSGKYKIEIAPETLDAGSVHGQLELSADGERLATPIPISGSVLPWIRTQPSRLFLGSIGKGEKFAAPRTFPVRLLSDTTPFDVTTARLPEIAGATWRCDPPQGTPALEKKLTLEFSPDALAAGLPFGALATKYLIAETTHPRAPRLVLPIQGMLSVNTTGRDYSQYLYNGTVRWEGRWATPNFAAAFLVTAVVFTCGLGAAIHARTRRKRWKIATAAIAFPVMALGCWYLAATYSRGGWIALGIGIAALLICGRPRFYPMGLAGLFALSVMLQPAGLDRASSTAAVTEDKSVSNRLLLWRGALQMMAEHPWRGVGAGKFGDVFKTDYQSPTHKEEYTTAINDYLTLGAERGVPLLILSMGGLLAGIGSGLWLGRQARNGFVIACAAAAAAYLACGWFSSILFQSDTSYFLLFACGGILFGLIWDCWRGRILPKRAIQVVLATGVACGVVLTVAFISFSTWALRLHPRTTPVEIAGLTGLEVTPRDATPKGTILYFGDADESPEMIARSTLRALAQKGWRVYSFNVSRYASSALAQSQPLVRDLKKLVHPTKLFVAGHRQGAQIALALAATNSFSGVGCYLTPSRSAFKDLSPADLASQVEEPIIYATQEADLQFSARDLSEIQPTNEPSSKQGVRIYGGTFKQSSPHWQEWIIDLDAFGSALQKQS
jgi:hypothetical protein